MDSILHNLAVGDHRDALGPPSNIDALLCVAEELHLPDLGIPCHKVPIVDMRPIPREQLKDAVKWIRDNIDESRIMVFCNAGVGRSPSVVVAYLCCSLGYGFGDAVEHVTRIRPNISTLPMLIAVIEEVKRELES